MPKKRRLDNETRKKYIGLRRQFNKPVVGITGMLGKTSVIHILSTILTAKERRVNHKSGLGNWQTNIKALEELNCEHDYAIFEFDYNRGNDFAELLRLIKPNIGIITNIGDAHLTYLGNMINITLEKSAVVKYLARDGVAVLNKDDELSSALADHISTGNVIKYGLSSGAHYYASEIELMGPAGISFLLNGKIKIKLPMYSIQDIYNLLAAVACAVNLDFALDEIVDILHKKYELPRGRGRILKTAKSYILDESYISTPRSLSKAARTLIGFKPYVDNIALIVGDMVGGGINTEEQHLNMGYFLSALPIDCLITVGEYAKYIGKGANLIKTDKRHIRHANNVDEILAIIDDRLNSTSAISVKGLGSAAVHRIEQKVREIE
ncbi:MAG: Mur ligase family protein [Calditrichaceae bacterium]